MILASNGIKYKRLSTNDLNVQLDQIMCDVINHLNFVFKYLETSTVVLRAASVVTSTALDVTSNVTHFRSGTFFIDIFNAKLYFLRPEKKSHLSFLPPRMSHNWEMAWQ